MVSTTRDCQIEQRLSKLEQRVLKLETHSTLDPKRTIPENIWLWFGCHSYLHVGTLDMELSAIGLVYSKNAVRSACHRLAKEGRLIRVKQAIYRRAL